MIVFLKDYKGFESLQDFERDIAEAFQEAEIPSGFQGTVTVSIVYTDDGEE